MLYVVIGSFKCEVPLLSFIVYTHTHTRVCILLWNKSGHKILSRQYNHGNKSKTTYNILVLKSVFGIL